MHIICSERTQIHRNKSTNSLNNFSEYLLGLGTAREVSYIRVSSLDFDFLRKGKD